MFASTALRRGAAAFAALALVTSLHAAPPAEQVMAEVNAAARIAVSLLDQLPAEGDVAQESAYVGGVSAAGLGEIMGWGQDRFDNVDPAITATLTAEFTQAFRALEGLPEDGGGIGYSQLQHVATTVRGHIDAIRAAVDQEPEPGRTRQELFKLAEFLTHHADELAGSPIYPNNRVAATVAMRTATTATRTLEADLASFPELAAQVEPQMGSIRGLATAPPACMLDAEPSDACLEGFSQTFRQPLASIAAAAVMGQAD